MPSNGSFDFPSLSIPYFFPQFSLSISLSLSLYFSLSLHKEAEEYKL